MMETNQNHLDVIVVGAGLSGIGAGYHLESKCPNKTYALLEGRDAIGGTWDLFRYPGIRSDSDMYTLGYSFRPWIGAKAIADGPSILEYVKETAREYGIDRKIRFGHQVVNASWSSDEARWTVTAKHQGKEIELTCSFLFMCSGYYDYDAGYTPDFPGMKSFGGKLVHPQFWPDDLDYTDKKVVVIGSGATAVTLVPELAKKAAHVTMLQRSPTYIVSAPEKDPVAHWLRGKISPHRAYRVTRLKNVLLSMALYQFCRRFPERAKKVLVEQAKRQVGERVDARHFTPTYNPWDQRLCLVPDGDLFKAMREGRADVVTDTIASFTPEGVKLSSGEVLEADIVVSATGLKMKFLGGMKVDLDGEPLVPNQHMTYKGMMLSDVPNLALAIGYTNASWTLKCDLTCEYVCRLIQHMDERGYTSCTPRQTDASIREEPLMDLNSGYIQRAKEHFPKQGSVAPWKVYQNYALDRLTLRHTSVDGDAMEFSRVAPRATARATDRGEVSRST